MKPSIGLLGANGAGKTTIADYLVAEHGYRKLSFAEPLRELAHLNQWWSREVKRDSYEEAKRRNPFVRDYLIDLGEGIRKYDPVYFVKALAQQITDMDPDRPWVVDDVRKQVEVNFLNDMGFRFVQVARGTKSGNLDVPLTGVVLPTRAELVITYDGEDWYKRTIDTLLRHAAWTLGGESADGSASVLERQEPDQTGEGLPAVGDGGAPSDRPAHSDGQEPEPGTAGPGGDAGEGGRGGDEGQGLGPAPEVRDGEGHALCDHPSRCGGVVLNPSHWPGDVRPHRL